MKFSFGLKIDYFSKVIVESIMSWTQISLGETQLVTLLGTFVSELRTNLPVLIKAFTSVSIIGGFESRRKIFIDEFLTIWMVVSSPSNIELFVISAKPILVSNTFRFDNLPVQVRNIFRSRIWKWRFLLAIKWRQTFHRTTDYDFVRVFNGQLVVAKDHVFKLHFDSI